MTPERAAYHRLMLLVGVREEYEQELDLALETEDPLSPLLLDLAFCMSDLSQTVSVLYNYALDESPMAYKAMEEIISQIGPTADIVEQIRPVYNFKASE